MSKKENEREVTSLLARIRESLRRPKKEDDAEELIEDSFDRDLSDRLEKHLGTQSEETEELRESNSESDFEVNELEIVADGALNPDQVDEAAETDAPDEENIHATGQAFFSDLDALMARMTPEQRTQFEAELNGMDEVSEDVPSSDEDAGMESEEIMSEEVTESLAQTEEPSEMETLATEPTVIENEKIDDGQMLTAEEEQDDEVYAVPHVDEEYDLSEVDAFRALEARMTPEQRAQFEQALAEAQEAERAEKMARREACRAAQEMECAKQADEDFVLSDEVEADREDVSDATVAVDEVVANEVTETEEAVSVPGNTAEDSVVVMAEDEPIAVELPPQDEDDGVQIAPPAEENTPSESNIFMAVGEDDDENDMPAIKVGSDPSAFTLVVEPEPEIEPDPEPTEEELLADLLARMTPEQRARFREEMFASDTDGDASEPATSETDDIFVVDDESEIMLDEPETVMDDGYGAVPAEKSAESKESVTNDEFTQTDDLKAVDFVSSEDALAAGSKDENENEGEKEDAIEEILNNPDKLEKLMSRLTPEQAAELREMLGADSADRNEDVGNALGVQSIEDEENEVDEPTDEPVDGDSADKLNFDETPESVLLDEDTDEEVFDDYREENPDEAQGDTDDGVAFEYSRTMEKDEAEEDLEDEEDMNVFEISDDMSDEEISLMLGLGYEKELVYTLGAERVEQVKNRTARENAHDPEFANAYAYEGEEYRTTDQDERIRYRYEVDRRRLWVRLIGTSVFALLLFLYECCGIFRGSFGDIFDAAHYPVITIMAGWQLLIFAAAFSWKQLLHGIRSAFVMEPDNHSMTAIVVAVVMFNNILMAIVFKGSNLYLYNFPAAICLLCSALCDLADLTRETLTFDVVSADAKKYVSESITLTPAHTSMPIMTIEDEKNNPLSSRNAMYVRRVGFVKNYFRRTNRKTHHTQILNFIFLPLLAFAAVMGVITALIGNGIAPALSGFVVSILLCMPLSYTVIHTLPLFYEARCLHKQGCAIVGEGTVEECNQFSTVVFEDKDIFPPTLITTKGLKLYENNQIYSVILKISLLFREIGGPINEVLDLDKEELKRFLASGRAGALENAQVYLDSVSEDGVTARMSDGSRVVAGSASFLSAHGIYVRVSEKDQQLIDSKELSILFLAFDGKLGARFYVDYRPDPEFEALAGMLHEDGFRVAIRTLDPGIYEEMIARKCPPEMPEVGTVRAKMRELTSKTGNDAKVDGGLVCSDDPRKMLLPLRAIRNLRRLNRFSLRLYGIGLLINMAVVVVLTACSAVGFMSSLFVSLYMLVWLATSLVTTALFLNK